MNTITKYVVLAALWLSVMPLSAQDTLKVTERSNRIEKLSNLKDGIQLEERELLKAEVEAINQRFDRAEITHEEAEILKKEAAKKHALNIENRIAIIDNQIELLKRNDYGSDSDEGKENRISILIGGGKKGIKIKGNSAPPKYDIRTSNDLLFAIGFNNTLIDGQNLDDSPYDIAGSGFVELGWNWKTRLLKNSNFIRFKYGVSLQWNKLSIKDNQYFVQDGDVTTLEEFPMDLKKSKFRTTSLVVPIHFEFGPSRIVKKDTHIRYNNEHHFKIGLGGFAGLNLSTIQKLKFEIDGDAEKQKIKKDYNTSNFMYGLSGYIGVGDFSIYAKYNLNSLFKDQAIDQHNISLGLRFDLD